uniref:Uncharacterized protein LOC111116604 n=1 Tax=Crassostrea virginica TaxID=6565 RepID=A0A8B8C6H7_CRAVI|nr:uncharacterized protein LOC111116604 [Crassostrea virginica]
MGSKFLFTNKATITPDQRFCELIESPDSRTFKLTGQKSVATQFNGINTKKRTWIFRAFLTLLLCSVVAEGAVLLFWARRCANSEIDQKITTPEKPFTSQPDTTKGRKTGIPTKKNRLSTTEYSLPIPITQLDTITTSNLQLILPIKYI